MADRALTDLELERWLADDLPADRTRAATAADRARLDELRAEHAAFLATVDIAAELRGIGRRVASASAAPVRRIAPRRAWLVPGGALAAAALVVVVVGVVLRGRPPDPDDDRRAKGGSVGLVIHAATRDDPRRIASGDPVRGGDRIRFEVSVPGPGYIAVVSVAASGAASVYYPFGGRAAAAIDPGAGAVLPGAVRLDAAGGDEQIYAVYGDRPFALDDALFAALRGGAPPAGTTATRIELHAIK